MTDTGVGGGYAKYQPIAELGEGGMAEVFLALASGPVGFNKLVVLKQIRERIADDPDFLTMFLDEARLAARLNHPNVVQTNEIGSEGDRYYICMEYLEGQPLNRVIGRARLGGGLPMGMGVRILIDALAGLHYAHELADFDGKPLQVVHRDATPHNIFVTYAGQVKVVDFGIAKALNSSSETRSGVLKGKIGYMAPEQVKGERVDRRADIFSVGMVLWEILTGKRPFKGVPEVTVLQHIVSGQIPSPLTVKPDVPPELERIVMKAIARDREERYATAAELASDLEEALTTLGDKSSVREAGKLVEKIFAPERERLRAVVEAHMSGRSMELTGVTSSSRSIRLPRIDDPNPDSIRRRDGEASLSGSAQLGRSSVPPSRTQVSTSQNLVPAISGEPPPDRSRRLVATVIGVALVAIGALALLVTRGEKQAEPQVGASTATATATPAQQGRVLRIDSSPPGAAVSEDGHLLGKTPMSVPLDPASNAARKIVVSLDGYVPYMFEQAPTQEDVRVVVPLAPVPTPIAQAGTADAQATQKPTRPGQHAPPPPPSAKQPPPTTPTSQPLDIKMTR